MVDQETFSADMALVTVTGVNIHPSIGKGRMVNAIRVASDFINTMPTAVSPECTDGRYGFMHLYVMDGGVAESTIKILLRDFETDKLAVYADLLKQLAGEVAAKHAGSKIDVEIVKQYRNMAEGLVSEPRAVALAVAAHEALGRKPELSIIRGGTDGSQLTEKGLPTPNLSSGQHNIHSPLEWACLDEMVGRLRSRCRAGQTVGEGLIEILINSPKVALRLAFCEDFSFGVTTRGNLEPTLRIFRQWLCIKRMDHSF